MMTQDTRSLEEVVALIRSVLVAHKNSTTYGMPVQMLNNEYQGEEGTAIPYRLFNYRTLMDFLRSLEEKNEIALGRRDQMDVVYLRVNEKIAHVSALVSRQKDSSKRHIRGGRRNTSRTSYPRLLYRPPRLDSVMLADVLNLIRSRTNGIHVNNVLTYLHDRDIHNIDRQRLISQLLENNREVTVEMDDMIYPVIRRQHSSQMVQRPMNVYSTNGYAAKSQAQPTTAVSIRPAGASDSEDDDNDNFESVYHTSSMNNNLRCPEIRQDSKPELPPSDENANVSSREDENSHTATDDDGEVVINRRTRFRLEKLIQKHPEGIWCAELPSFYQKEYRIPLNYEDLGFGSVTDFVAHLPEIFHIVQPEDKGDFKLYNAKEPQPETKQRTRPAKHSLAALHNIYESYCEETDAVPVTLSPMTSQKLVPDGALTIGETVPQIFVTELFYDETDYLDVVVVDVITPTFFWIHLLKRTLKFHKFMKELHDFYSLNARQYIIPIVLLEKGLNCACVYDNKWHRAIIKTVKPDNTVTVMFYDYGTVQSYPPEEIHFLDRSFSSLPAQAIPCGLFNVKPKSSTKWPYEVCTAFVDKVLDIPLVATLGSIDVDNNSMLIGLTNTEGDTDLHVNDWMISTGYAVLGKMVCIRPPNYPFRRYLECAYGRTSDAGKKKSKSAKVVRSTVNAEAAISAASLSKESCENSSFYETLLKLRRKPINDSLEASKSSGQRGEESRNFNPAVSQAAKIASPKENDAAIIKQDDGDEPSCSRGKNDGRNLLNSLLKAHANRIAAISASSSDSAAGARNSSDVGLKSGASSSSVTVVLPDRKNISAERNSLAETTRNPKTGTLIAKRKATLLEFIASKRLGNPETGAESSNVSLCDDGDGGNGVEPESPKTLHLKPEMTSRKNGALEFGEIYSMYGGQGRMEPIDWVGCLGKEERIAGGKSSSQTASKPPENREDSQRYSTTFQKIESSKTKTSPNRRVEISKPEEKALATNSTADLDIATPTKAPPKLPQAKKAFLDFVTKSKQKNARTVLTALNERRKENPEKSEAPSNDASKTVKKMPEDFQPVRASFINIMKSSLPTAKESGGSFCEIQGNITQQTGSLSPQLISIVKSVKEKRGEKQRQSRDVRETVDSVSLKSSSSCLSDAKEIRSLGKTILPVDETSSDTAPDTSESQSPTNDASSDLDSSNDTPDAISGNVLKSTGELSKPDNTSAIAPSNDAQKMSRNVVFESIRVAKNASFLQSEGSRERICPENAGKRVDSVVEEVSRCRLQNLLTSSESGSIRSTIEAAAVGSIKKAENSTKTDKSDCYIPEEDSVTDGQSKLSHSKADKITNAGSENDSLRRNETLLTKVLKFMRARNESADDSGLGPDNTSLEEDTKKQKEEEGKQPVNETSDFREAEKISGRPVCPLNKNNESSLQFVKESRESIPLFDDTCLDSSDSEEWDFSPGRGLIPIEEQKLENLRELTESVDGDLDGARQEKRLLSQNIDTIFEEGSANDSTEEKQKNASHSNSFAVLGSSSQGNATSDAGTSNFRGSSRFHDYFTDENEIADYDKVSNSTKESLKKDTNNEDSSKLLKQASYSILSEVQKSNISAKVDSFANISSSSSSCSSVGKSNDESYAKSLLSAVRQYL